MKPLFDQLEHLILIKDASQKTKETLALADNIDIHLNSSDLNQSSQPIDITTPGYPQSLRLVAPRQLKKRSIQTQEGRNVLMHAIAHIEFNAINLALDAAYRYRDQPMQYYYDWISIAADEARHFTMIREYLNVNKCDYADLPAHNGLWEMAVDTSQNVIARMALVPRVLEARGLDVTPKMIEGLRSVGDVSAVSILDRIYTDEITHVRVGSFWFNFLCEKSALEPRTTFINLVKKHLHGELKGPFNIAARLQAGFDKAELASLENYNHHPTIKEH